MHTTATVPARNKNHLVLSPTLTKYRPFCSYYDKKNRVCCSSCRAGPYWLQQHLEVLLVHTMKSETGLLMKKLHMGRPVLLYGAYHPSSAHLLAVRFVPMLSGAARPDILLRFRTACIGNAADNVIVYITVPGMVVVVVASCVYYMITVDGSTHPPGINVWVRTTSQTLHTHVGYVWVHPTSQALHTRLLGTFGYIRHFKPNLPDYWVRLGIYDISNFKYSFVGVRLGIAFETKSRVQVYTLLIPVPTVPTQLHVFSLWCWFESRG